jgi:hypothetical protein
MREVERLEKKGARVLRGFEAEKALSWNNQEYVRLDDDCYEYNERELAKLEEAAGEDEDIDTSELKDQTYRDLVGDQVETIVAVDPHSGKHYGLAKAEDIRQALKEKHGIDIPATRSTGGDDWKERQKKAQKEKQIRQQATAEICGRIVQSLTDNPITITSRRQVEPFLQAVALHLVNEGDADVARFIAKRRDIPYNSNDTRGSVAKVIPGLSGQTTMEFIVEYLITKELEYWIMNGENSWGAKKAFPICAYFGFDPKVIEKRIAKEISAQEKAKQKKSKAKQKVTVG